MLRALDQQSIPRTSSSTFPGRKGRTPALAERVSARGTVSLAAPLHPTDGKVKSLREHMVWGGNETGLSRQQPLGSHHREQLTPACSLPTFLGSEILSPSQRFKAQHDTSDFK